MGGREQRVGKEDAELSGCLGWGIKWKREGPNGRQHGKQSWWALGTP